MDTRKFAFTILLLSLGHAALFPDSFYFQYNSSSPNATDTRTGWRYYYFSKALFRLEETSNTTVSYFFQTVSRELCLILRQELGNTHPLL